jgi:hypothetical protein
MSGCRKFHHAGLPCITGFNGTCNVGYVGVTKAHPAFGKDYDDLNIEIHGGLTFGADERPFDWKEDGLFWFGFDTAHCAPTMSLGGFLCDEGWSDEMVDAETRKLAEQLAGMKGDKK